MILCAGPHFHLALIDIPFSLSQLSCTTLGLGQYYALAQPFYNLNLEMTKSVSYVTGLAIDNLKCIILSLI